MKLRTRARWTLPNRPTSEPTNEWGQLENRESDPDPLVEVSAEMESSLNVRLSWRGWELVLPGVRWRGTASDVAAGLRSMADEIEQAAVEVTA